MGVASSGVFITAWVLADELFGEQGDAQEEVRRSTCGDQAFHCSAVGVHGDVVTDSISGQVRDIEQAEVDAGVGAELRVDIEFIGVEHRDNEGSVPCIDYAMAAGHTDDFTKRLGISLVDGKFSFLIGDGLESLIN
nr:hypothetical protein [Corynebacterium epidermidicanis]